MGSRSKICNFTWFNKAISSVINLGKLNKSLISDDKSKDAYVSLNIDEDLDLVEEKYDKKMTLK